MDDGWIKLHRSALDHALFQNDGLWKLWCWCLLKANHKTGNYQGTVVPRGSFVTGKHIAKEELGVPPTTWFRRLRQLSEPPYDCISVKSGPKFTLVTVINYDTYQDKNEKRGTEMEPRWNRDGTEMAPIEEQQEPLSLPAWANLKIPDRYDTPEVLAWIPQWQAYWPTVRNGDRLTPQVFLSQLQLAAQLGWDASKLCRSFLKSVAVSARNLIDPDDGRPAPTHSGSGYKSKREAEPSYPTLGPRPRKDGGM